MTDGTIPLTEEVPERTMDVHQICAMLAAEGILTAPAAIQIQSRDDRWAVSLPDHRMAWIPMNAQGARRLAVERRILNLVAACCAFRAPRVLHVAAAGWDLRALVPGECDPFGLYRRLQNDRALARQLGRSVGGILADLHRHIRAEDARGWLQGRLSWPKPWEEIETNLPAVVDNADLLQDLADAIAQFRADEDVPSDDCVLVHGDLGLHNIAITPGADSVAGIFDFDGAAWVDRHFDFRYLVFDRVDDAALAGALEVYEGELSLQLDRRRIRRHNAACAIGLLAHRRGFGPEDRPCGRTLAEDIRWVRHALAAMR